jgi:lysophospholipid acyltransferase (LPLAT)-like uncharacterized protein
MQGRRRPPGRARLGRVRARRAASQAALAWLAATYIRLVHRTGRWELRCDPATARLIRSRRPFIGAFWHGRMLMIAAAWAALLRELRVGAPLQACVVSSDHPDGRLMARATARFGIRTVFGSTRQGRSGLLRAALRVIEQNQIPVFTPDGPRGPRMRAKAGIVRLAMRTGVPIVPITFAASNQRLLASWDRFALALPLARGVLAFGAPLEFGRDGDPEAGRRLLEQRLNELTLEADRALGLTPLEPAPAEPAR